MDVCTVTGQMEDPSGSLWSWVDLGLNPGVVPSGLCDLERVSLSFSFWEMGRPPGFLVRTEKGYETSRQLCRYVGTQAHATSTHSGGSEAGPGCLTAG